MAGLTLLSIPRFRNALLGNHGAGVSPFASNGQAFVTSLAAHPPDEHFVTRFEWD